MRERADAPTGSTYGDVTVLCQVPDTSLLHVSLRTKSQGAERRKQKVMEREGEKSQQEAYYQGQ